MVETYVSAAATGERETEDTFTGIAWGAGAAAASCLHPETERPNAAVAARARMNFGLEDLISDNVFLLKNYTELQVYVEPLSSFERLDEPRRRRILKKTGRSENYWCFSLDVPVKTKMRKRLAAVPRFLNPPDHVSGRKQRG
jgi:hypothetical protein